MLNGLISQTMEITERIGIFNSRISTLSTLPLTDKLTKKINRFKRYRKAAEEKIELINRQIVHIEDTPDDLTFRNFPRREKEPERLTGKQIWAQRTGNTFESAQDPRPRTLTGNKK